MAKSGLGLIEIASSLNEIKPDIALTIGDRFETMATTVPSIYEYWFGSYHGEKSRYY